MKKILQLIMILLALIGAINWGLIGSLNMNVIELGFGKDSLIARLIYLLVSLASLWVILQSNSLIRRHQKYPTKQQAK